MSFVFLLFFQKKKKKKNFKIALQLYYLDPDEYGSMRIRILIPCLNQNENHSAMRPNLTELLCCGAC